MLKQKTADSVLTFTSFDVVIFKSQAHDPLGLLHSFHEVFKPSSSKIVKAQVDTRVLTRRCLKNPPDNLARQVRETLISDYKLPKWLFVYHLDESLELLVESFAELEVFLSCLEEVDPLVHDEPALV